MDQDKKAATVDYHNRVEVVQHFRDLINLSPLLEKGLDREVNEFRVILAVNGWSARDIQKAYEDAARFTVYESQIPPVIRDGN